ncbi:MAG TPA: type II toxin-antitoxin system Phd/YefM family antitoxin [Candidatus Latescibacteria bacterium]|jgi:prevent-host-death family protein|nr:prevent-host-death family protein [Gemmatimonadaceae bacterium]HJP31841.1 type II toxin-antitoxin system Phd/YefM family antitoxin [Candidatus Latescibacterota bacterium]|tara:strand:+ start:590 stop:880 length:291 start_codon:yes stop_codon:yes gene_type:complete
MQTISAHEAKARFGQLLDAARVEPVTIEKHGRPVAVLISKQEYDETQAAKLARLRAEVQQGLDAIGRGDSTEYEEADLQKLAGVLKSEARQRAASS